MRFWMFVATIALLALPAFAQENTAPTNSKPVVITADGSLEWQRNDKLFIANKNALAQQGDTSVAGDKLTAYYRDDESADKTKTESGNGMEIWRVVADQNVIISSRDSNAYGAHADYDLDKGVAIMTGDDLRMTSPDQVVTAKERFEYWVNTGRLNAIGDARVERLNQKGERNILRAQKISALLKDNAAGERVLDTLEATGSVIITTPTEVVTGAYGIYHADTNTAQLSGGVTITRGPNKLEGDKAEVDLNTNTSRLLGGRAKTGGQVRGIFYPGSEKKPGKTTP